jgi:hypothetical protein
VDPKNWTVFDQQHTVQKGESTDGKTSNFQTGIQGPRRPSGDQALLAELEQMVGRLTMELEAAKKASQLLSLPSKRNGR